MKSKIDNYLNKEELKKKLKKINRNESRPRHASLSDVSDNINVFS